MGKIILLTGASSGMGREAAILLASEGHTVYAGARRLDRMDDLSEHSITPVEMDVSKGEDNERAVRRIVDDQFEVNLFGLAHLTQPEAMSRGTEASVLAQVFVEAATAAKPRRRYVKGAFARPLMFIRKWFGDAVYESALRRAFR